MKPVTVFGSGYDNCPALALNKNHNKMKAIILLGTLKKEGQSNTLVLGVLYRISEKRGSDCRNH